MPRRPRPNSVWLVAIALLSVGLATLILVLAAFDTLAAHRDADRYGLVIPPDPQSFLLNRSFDVLTGLWVFTVGASVGSFLNVVAYRMPAGIGLSREGSRCPWCLGSIRARDNVPILGWLALRGRCRNCRLPISSRYPIVEAITGSMFLLVYLFELTMQTRWLPGGPLRPPLETSQIVLDQRLDLLLPFLVHLIALTTLWGAALMIWDAEQPPRRYWITTFLLLIVVIASQPLVVWGLEALGEPQLPRPMQQYPVVALDGLVARSEVPAWLRSSLAVGVLGGLVGGLIAGVMGLVLRLQGTAQVLPSSQQADCDVVRVTTELPAGEGGERIAVEVVASGKHAAASSRPGSSAFADAGLPIVVGMVWGWQTLLPVTALCCVLILVLPRIGHTQATAARIRGIAWTAATLIVTLTWNFWVSWTGV